MKRKSMVIFGVIGVLTLSIGYMKDLESTEVLAKEQPKLESVLIGQADVDHGDQYKFVTIEEQEMRENDVENRNRNTTITVEEQKMVENSTTLSGFMSQENGSGFFFNKEK